MIVNDAHTEYAMKGQAQVDWQEIYKNHASIGTSFFLREEHRKITNFASNQKFLNFHIFSTKVQIKFPEDNLGFDPCRHGGVTNETDGSCVCTRWYSGDKCETPVCMNDGYFNHTLGRCVCTSNWVGEHCIFRCNSGVVNKTSGMRISGLL